MFPVPDPELAVVAIAEFLKTPVEWYFHLALQHLRARPRLAQRHHRAHRLRRRDLRRPGRRPRHDVPPPTGSPDATYVELRGSHFIQMEQPDRVHDLLVDLPGAGGLRCRRGAALVVAARPLLLAGCSDGGTSAPGRTLTALPRPRPPPPDGPAGVPRPTEGGRHHRHRPRRAVGHRLPAGRRRASSPSGTPRGCCASTGRPRRRGDRDHRRGRARRARPGCSASRCPPTSPPTTCCSSTSPRPTTTGSSGRRYERRAARAAPGDPRRDPQAASSTTAAGSRSDRTATSTSPPARPVTATSPRTRTPRRQDPADHADGEPAPGNPFPDSPVWTLRAPQRRPGLRRPRPAVGLGVRAEHLGRAQPDRAGRQLRLAAGRGPRRPAGPASNPQVVWDPAEASPSGLAFLDGHLWLAALRGERLWRIDVTGGRATRSHGLLRRRVRPAAHRRSSRPTAGSG